MGCGGCQQAAQRRIARKTAPKNKSAEPVKRPDGSLLYQNVAPRKDGYMYDPKNPKRLVMDLFPCKYRLNAPLLDKDGKHSTMNMCNNPSYEGRGKSVEDKICSECPSRNLP